MAIIIFGFSTTSEASRNIFIDSYILFFGDSDDLREEGCELVTDRCHNYLRSVSPLPKTLA